MRPLRTWALAAIALVATGCGLWIEQAPGDIGPQYRRTWAKIARIERTPVEERGRAHSVHVWLYDGGEDRLVEASVPLWLVRKIAKGSLDDEMDLGEAPLRHKIKIDDLLSRGPGLVIQADEEANRVLVWLD